MLQGYYPQLNANPSFHNVPFIKAKLRNLSLGTLWGLGNNILRLLVMIEEYPIHSLREKKMHSYFSEVLTKTLTKLHNSISSTQVGKRPIALLFF